MNFALISLRFLSYLRDSEREGGFGDNDIYASFRQKNGSWGEAIILGDKINIQAQEGGPMITPDDKYLFLAEIWMIKTL